MSRSVSKVKRAEVARPVYIENEPLLHAILLDTERATYAHYTLDSIIQYSMQEWLVEYSMQVIAVDWFC